MVKISRTFVRLQCTLIACYIIISCCIDTVVSWKDFSRSHPHVNLEDTDVLRFSGNRTHSDHFKLLERDGDSLLVGARNVVYNISLHDLSKNSNIVWYSSDKDRHMCDVKGNNEDDCQNYIRVLVTTKNTVLVCGTNAYNPLCRYYARKNDGEYDFITEKSGHGICPFDPDHNSTAIYAEGELYVGTVADFSGTDPLIHREPVRTDKSDPKQLNAPDFVGSIHHQGFVYFFFRESAVEYINCGKAVYSRIGRVCTNDKGGGESKYDNGWTSFLKSRLNCSVAGEFPFYFNEIQSTSQIVSGTYAGQKHDIIYAVFTTPPNSIGGSAICAFKMADIEDTFNGNFKGQKNRNWNWLPVESNNVPKPRPGTCVNNSKALPGETLSFLKSHPLMDDSVPSFSQQPLLIRTGVGSRLTQVTVDPQVRAPDGRTYDVMFIGTSNGRVLKAINAKSPDSSEEIVPVIIEEIQVFPRDVPITNLQVYRSVEEPYNMKLAKLIVVSKDEIQAIKLSRCYTDKISSCSECISLQDPYCAWDISSQICSSSGYPNWSTNDFLQNVKDGYHADCPGGSSVGSSGDQQKLTGKTSVVPTTTASPSCPPCPTTCVCNSSATMYNSSGKPPGKNGPTQYSFDSSNPETRENDGRGSNNRHSYNRLESSSDRAASKYLIYTAETLAIAVTTSIVLSLVIGFIAGYIFSRHCRSDDSPYDNDHLVDQQHKANCLVHDPTPHINHSDSYLPSAQPINKPAINLVLNVPPKNGNGKNANSSADNKPVQKVKKIYL